MSYPISAARKFLYDSFTAALPTLVVIDSIPDNDAEPATPFLLFELFFITGASSKCGYSVQCQFSIYSQFIRRGGTLEGDTIAGQIFQLCETFSNDVTVQATAVRTFNRANYRQQFTLTLNDI